MPLITVVAYDGEVYFVDVRLHELRNVNDPHDFFRFSTEFEMMDYLDEVAAPMSSQTDEYRQWIEI